MKKIMMIVALISSWMTLTAQGADSTITISGYIRDNTCQVDVGSQNFSVELQTDSIHQFYKYGVSSAAVPFEITLTSCGVSARGVRIGFSGMSTGGNNSFLMNNAADNKADGISVQILNSNREVVLLNQALNTLPWDRLIPNTSNTFKFYARMAASSYPVTAGLVQADATISFEYQ